MVLRFEEEETLEQRAEALGSGILGMGVLAGVEIEECERKERPSGGNY